ncbi:MAG: 1-acyl-sn-glycerol-3-phosphate acyltransferase [Anaerolineae bacterium]|nr:1-acyl-sn-glycerol-3-phosphate acyltransferase [Anaerolineae bacterium]
MRKGRRVTLPLWLFLTGIVLALWALLDRLLFPSLRWFFRRQANQALEEMNKRLPVQLPAFKLTKRRVLLDRLQYDPQVIAAVDAYCEAKGVPRFVAMEKVSRYAHEIVPAFNAYVYFRIANWLSKTVAKSLYRVRIGYVDSDNLFSIKQDDSIVLVMNHRSNMDYILLSYVASEYATLSYAVGEWARIFPLQQLIRATGAYFVRRGSGNELYRRVLERYVQMATEGGVVQAMFPEGGLSRDGYLRRPKIGLLDYMLRTFKVDGPRDIIFVPVAVNYDRVLEDRTLLLDTDPNAERKTGRAALLTTISFLGRQIRLRLRGEWYRHGYAVVNVGTPISLRAYAQAHDIDFTQMARPERIAEAQRLADTLMNAIGNVLPVLPVAAVATVFMGDPERAFSEAELQTAVAELLTQLEADGAQIYVPRSDRAYTIRVGLRMLALRRLVQEKDGMYRVVDKNLPVLRYYARSIVYQAPAD